MTSAATQWRHTRAVVALHCLPVDHISELLLPLPSSTDKGLLPLPPYAAVCCCSPCSLGPLASKSTSTKSKVSTAAGVCGCLLASAVRVTSEGPVQFTAGHSAIDMMSEPLLVQPPHFCPSCRLRHPPDPGDSCHRRSLHPIPSCPVGPVRGGLQ